LRDKEFSDEIKAWSCYEEKNFKEWSGWRRDILTHGSRVE
jgi:hypothetical protein